MKKFLFGLIVGLCLVPVRGLLFIRLGYAPVATSSPPLPFERTLATMALRAAVERQAPKTVPIAASESNLIAGAKIYHADCSVCHGLIGQPKSAIADGEFPPPPQLLVGTGVTNDPAGETYWKATYGIRLTGMPGFMEALTDQQRWQVSLMLANANKLPEAAKKILSQPLDE